MGDIMSDFRVEKDSMGKVNVPKKALWGAQTQRSLQNFQIGEECIPLEVIQAFAVLKMACAKVNFLDKEGLENEAIGLAITNACLRILSGDYDEHFPLSVWQTGSGTQTNMNVNEVIANLANKELKKASIKLHPNDHINKSQSSNDTFPTAMNMAIADCIEEYLLPSIDGLVSSFKKIEKENKDVIKAGRTHLQDATPIKFSQEVSSWRYSLEVCKEQIVSTLKGVKTLAIGGTAVGTGLNAPKDFDKKVVNAISNIMESKYYVSKNKFHALGSKDTLVFCHGALKALSCDLIKIANDIRFLSCGPRTGIGEISIPANEPGSSIMPGKVNPTQCEALIMTCMQVQGNDVTISNAASSGMLELNVAMPVIAYNFIQSIRLLSDAINSFNNNCVSGIKVNASVMKQNLDNSLMNATILNPVLGYEKVAKMVNYANDKGITLKEACLKLKYLSEKEFDKYYDYKKMV